MRKFEKFIIGIMAALIVNMIPGEWTCEIGMRFLVLLIVAIGATLIVAGIERYVDDRYLD